MRGGFLHNHVLLDPVEALFQAIGVQGHREYPTGPGRGAGFIDFFVIYQGDRIAVEVELSPDRVKQDLTKAAVVEATLLVILVPHGGVAKAIRRRLSRLDGRPSSPEPEIWILSLGSALQRLTQRCHLMISVNVPQTLNPPTTSRDPRAQGGHPARTVRK